MPQLMPFSWINTTFMFIFIIITLMMFYFYKNFEMMIEMILKKNFMKKYNFMW